MKKSKAVPEARLAASSANYNVTSPQLIQLRTELLILKNMRRRAGSSGIQKTKCIFHFTLRLFCFVIKTVQVERKKLEGIQHVKKRLSGHKPDDIHELNGWSGTTRLASLLFTQTEKHVSCFCYTETHRNVSKSICWRNHDNNSRWVNNEVCDDDKLHISMGLYLSRNWSNNTQ